MQFLIPCLLSALTIPVKSAAVNDGKNLIGMEPERETGLASTESYPADEPYGYALPYSDVYDGMDEGDADLDMSKRRLRFVKRRLRTNKGRLRVVKRRLRFAKTDAMGPQVPAFYYGYSPEDVDSHVEDVYTRELRAPRLRFYSAPKRPEEEIADEESPETHGRPHFREKRSAVSNAFTDTADSSQDTLAKRISTNQDLQLLTDMLLSEHQRQRKKELGALIQRLREIGK